MLFRSRGVKYYSQGQYKMALLDFNRSILMDPENPKAFYYRGLTAQKLGDHAQAKLDFEKARQLDPTIATGDYADKKDASQIKD